MRYTGSEEKEGQFFVSNQELEDALAKAYQDGRNDERPFWLIITIVVTVLLVVMLFIAIHYAKASKKV